MVTSMTMEFLVKSGAARVLGEEFGVIWQTDVRKEIRKIEVKKIIVVAFLLFEIHSGYMI